MFLWDWFSSFFHRLAFWHRRATILFLGLDNAGKTTLLHTLLENKLAEHVPTFHPNCEELSLGNLKFTIIDVGGHYQARRLWRDYFPAVDAIVFFIDAYDRERFLESKVELDYLLADESLQNCTVLILGTKIDKPGAASEVELRQYFQLHTSGKEKRAQTEVPGRPIELYMCSVLKRQGYGDAFRWLSLYI